jgi:hypothetical protein
MTQGKPGHGASWREVVPGVGEAENEARRAALHVVALGQPIRIAVPIPLLVVDHGELREHDVALLARGSADLGEHEP